MPSLLAKSGQSSLHHIPTMEESMPCNEGSSTEQTTEPGTSVFAGTLQQAGVERRRLDRPAIGLQEKAGTCSQQSLYQGLAGWGKAALGH